VETTFEPISKRRLGELRGYVWWGTTIFRSGLFVAAVAALAWLLRTVHVRLGRPIFDSESVWLLPSLAFAIALYVHARRWTGGAAFRAAVRADLARGVAAVHRVVAVDAVEVEEGGDEGPSFFILADDGSTILFRGQYLGPYKRKGFPWRIFEILEAPESKIFYGLKPQGEKLPPSVRRPPLSWAEYKEFANIKHEYAVVDVDFEALKEGRLTRRRS
jgi:hypothetical protein